MLTDDIYLVLFIFLIFHTRRKIWVLEFLYFFPFSGHFPYPRDFASFAVPSELSAAGAKRGVRSLPARSVFGRQA